MKSPSNTSQNGGNGAPGQALMTSFPVIQLRNRLLDRLGTLEKFAPHSDAVATLKECLAELEHALTLGRDTGIYISVDEASRIFGRPRSTITYICRTNGKAVGAKKVEGVWVINRHVMTSYFDADSREVM